MPSRQTSRAACSRGECSVICAVAHIARIVTRAVRSPNGCPAEQTTDHLLRMKPITMLIRTSPRTCSLVIGATTLLAFSGRVPPGLRIRCLHLAAGLASVVLSSTAMAQANVPEATLAASAPLAAKPRLNPLAPQDLRESATAPGDLHPAHAAVPQINIPFGKNQAAAAKLPSSAARSGNAASAGGIDDAVARCEAEVDRHVRATCRARLAREDRSR
jgi:hypothetical protein